MSSFIQLPSKITTSIISVEVNFISQLVGTEAVVSVVTTAIVFSGVDATPSAIVSGVGSLAANTFTQTITGGTAGVTYLLAFAATTSTSNQLIIYAYLAVTDSNPFQ